MRPDEIENFVNGSEVDFRRGLLNELQAHTLLLSVVSKSLSVLSAIMLQDRTGRERMQAIDLSKVPEEFRHLIG